MTEKELMLLRNQAMRLWLSGWYCLSNTELCLRECNGCGAEWMPKWIRTFLDFILQLFAPAVAIHDMRYFRNEGKREDWDAEFFVNCCVIAVDKYSWYNPCRYLALLTARRLYVTLIVCGEKAWREAGKRFAEDV